LVLVTAFLLSTSTQTDTLIQEHLRALIYRHCENAVLDFPLYFVTANLEMAQSAHHLTDCAVILFGKKLIRCDSTAFGLAKCYEEFPV
jgi:hypothetical protein